MGKGQGVDGWEVLEMGSNPLPRMGASGASGEGEGKGSSPLLHPPFREAAPVQEAKAEGPVGPASGVAVLRKCR